MELQQAIQERRSHKLFDKTHQLSSNEIDRLKQPAILSPPAFNLQHWLFDIATDQNLRENNRKESLAQSPTTVTALLIVLTGDLMAWDKEPERYWKNAPQTSRY